VTDHREAGGADQQTRELSEKWAALCRAQDEFRDCFERHLKRSGTVGPNTAVPPQAPPFWLSGAIPAIAVPAPEPGPTGSPSPRPGISAGAAIGVLGGYVQPPPPAVATDNMAAEAKENKLVSCLIAMMNDFMAQATPLIDQLRLPFADQYQIVSQLIQINQTSIAAYEAFRPEAAALDASGHKKALKQLELLVDDAKKGLATCHAILAQKAAVDGKNAITMFNAGVASVSMMQDAQRRAADVVERTIRKFTV
jgi:hypothetical protein